MFAIFKKVRYNRITGVENRPALTAVPQQSSRTAKEGFMMNYLEWSEEYTQNAEELAKVIERLKAKRKGCSKAAKKELEARIAQYRVYHGECVRIAALLRERHRGAA